jgi:hypothetical protein
MIGENQEKRLRTQHETPDERTIRKRREKAQKAKAEREAAKARKNRIYDLHIYDIRKYQHRMYEVPTRIRTIPPEEDRAYDYYF